MYLLEATNTTHLYTLHYIFSLGIVTSLEKKKRKLGRREDKMWLWKKRIESLKTRTNGEGNMLIQLTLEFLNQVMGDKFIVKWFQSKLMIAILNKRWTEPGK